MLHKRSVTPSILIRCQEKRTESWEKCSFRVIIIKTSSRKEKKEKKKEKRKKGKEEKEGKTMVSSNHRFSNFPCDVSRYTKPP